MQIEKRCQGLQFSRLNCEDADPHEKIIVEEWQKMHACSDTLSYLLDTSHRGRPLCPSDRDCLVAATVIQWLGSKEGRSFVNGVYGRDVDFQLDIKPSFLGLHSNRYGRELDERRFAEAWQRKHQREDLLARLLCPSAQDRKVAATLIQWLGSHVGSCFLDEVRRRWRTEA